MDDLIVVHNPIMTRSNRNEILVNLTSSLATRDPVVTCSRLRWGETDLSNKYGGLGILAPCLIEVEENTILNRNENEQTRLRLQEDKPSITAVVLLDKTIGEESMEPPSALLCDVNGDEIAES